MARFRLLVYLNNSLWKETPIQCIPVMSYELGLDLVFQVILGLSNPVVSNSLTLLSNLQQRCILDLGSSILCCKYYTPSVILFNILLFHFLTFVIFFIQNFLFLIMKLLTVLVIIFNMEEYELFEILLHTKTLNDSND